jgi:hypothetical protein
LNWQIWTIRGDKGRENGFRGVKLYISPVFHHGIYHHLVTAESLK